jgi:hypothetical protein
METDPKKPRTMNVLIEEYGKNLTRDTAFMMLTKAEVGDAMNFVIAQANDPRFKVIRDVMNKDTIWCYWTRRDMEVIFHEEWNENSTLWETTDKPKWKVYYLWLRFFVTMQQTVFVKQMRQMRQMDIVRLNVIKDNSNNFVYDPREFFPRQPIGYSYRKCLFMFHGEYLGGEDDDTSNVISVLGWQGVLIFQAGVFGEMHNCLKERRNTFNFKDKAKPYLAVFPTSRGHHKIFLATCISCGVKPDLPMVEKTNSNNVFCDSICQKLYYYK